jgi:hypothetical protein
MQLPAFASIKSLRKDNSQLLKFKNYGLHHYRNKLDLETRVNKEGAECGEEEDGR